MPRVLRLSSDLTLRRASTFLPRCMRLMEKQPLREQLLRKSGSNCSPSTKANILKKQRTFQEDLMEDSPKAGSSICQRRAPSLLFRAQCGGANKWFIRYKSTDAAVASRKLSETVLSKLYPIIPELVGGSADLTGSNLTRAKEAIDFQPPSTKLGDYAGRYIRYGVREHAMAGIMNGLAAYGTIIPFGGTFLNFVSYAAGSVRLSALSHIRCIHVATHDSYV